MLSSTRRLSTGRQAPLAGKPVADETSAITRRMAEKLIELDATKGGVTRDDLLPFFSNQEINTFITAAAELACDRSVSRLTEVAPPPPVADETSATTRRMAEKLIELDATKGGVTRDDFLPFFSNQEIDTFIRAAVALACDRRVSRLVEVAPPPPAEDLPDEAEAPGVDVKIRRAAERAAEFSCIAFILGVGIVLTGYASFNGG
jgi:hypothetical protein